jgi:glycosyltransferase involved in cell wall biosynthesis
VKVLVCPHELTIGGSPINAIDLGAAVTELGHEAIVYAPPGPLVEYVKAKGLRYVPARPARVRPSPARIVELAGLARREGADLVHAYEWPPCLDAYFGARLLGGVPLVCTVLSMALPPLVPGSVPLVMGTAQLCAEARAARHGAVELIEPPVDTDRDHPDLDRLAFRQQHGIAADEFLVVTVSRLTVTFKLDALERAIDAVGRVAHRLPVVLALVGDGDAYGQLSRRAEAVNMAVGRRAVVLTGPTMDPRPAYAAADVALGMGSSIIRAMACGRPVVIQGGGSYSAVFDADTCATFMAQGFYGTADPKLGPDGLAAQLERLLRDPALRARLGEFGRQVAVDRYSLRSAAATLVKLYYDALDDRPARRARLPEAISVGGRAVAEEMRLRWPPARRPRRVGAS